LLPAGNGNQLISGNGTASNNTVPTPPSSGNSTTLPNWNETSVNNTETTLPPAENGTEMISGNETATNTSGSIRPQSGNNTEVPNRNETSVNSTESTLLPAGNGTQLVSGNATASNNTEPTPPSSGNSTTLPNWNETSVNNTETTLPPAENGTELISGNGTTTSNNTESTLPSSGNITELHSANETSVNNTELSLPPSGNGTEAIPGNETAANSIEPTLMPAFNYSESTLPTIGNGTHANTSNETVTNNIEVTLPLSGNKTESLSGNKTSVNSTEPTLSPSIGQSDGNVFDLEGVSIYNESTISGSGGPKTPNNGTRLTPPTEYQTAVVTGNGASLNVFDHQDTYSVKVLDRPSHDGAHGKGAEIPRRLRASVNARECYAFYGSFKVQPVNSSVSALSVVQAYENIVAMAVSRGDLQDTLNSVAFLPPLKVLPIDSVVLSQPTTVEIQSAFIISSSTRLRPEELQPGGSTTKNLEHAFTNVTSDVVGNSSILYLQGSSIINEIVEAPCPNNSTRGEICYLVQGSYELQIANKTDRETAKQEIGAATEEAIDSGALQKVLRNIDSASSISILSGLQPSVISATPTQIPTTSPTIQPSSLPSATFSGRPSVTPSTSASSFTPTASSMPSSRASNKPSMIPPDLPSFLPSVIASEGPSGSTLPSRHSSARPTPVGSSASNSAQTGSTQSLTSPNNVAGIVIGVFLVLCLCAAALFCIYKHRKAVREELSRSNKLNQRDANYDDVNTSANYGGVYDESHEEAERKMFRDDLDDYTDSDGEVTDDERDAEMGGVAEQSVSPEASAKAAPTATAGGFVGFSLFRRNKRDQPLSPVVEKDSNATSRSGHRQDETDLFQSNTMGESKYNMEDMDDDDNEFFSAEALERASTGGTAWGKKQSKEKRDSDSDSDEEPSKRAGLAKVRNKNEAPSQSRPVDDDDSSYSRSDSYSSSSGSSYSSRSNSSSESDYKPRKSVSGAK
jgi:hypothetical protein